MQTVSVENLKNDLSVYLENVKRGEEVFIQESDQTIAKIVPLDEESEIEEELAELTAQGIISPPETNEIPDWFWEEENLSDISVETIVKILREERDED